MPAQPTRRPTDDHDESFPVGLLGPGHDSGGEGGLLSSFLTRNLGLGRRVVFPSFVKDFEGVKSSRVAHRQRKLEYLRVERI